MSRTPFSFKALVVALAAITIVAAGCGSDDGGAADGGDADATTGVADSDLELVEVSNGAETDLAAVLANEDGKPKLAWFWAPHCPTCRGEAPELDEFIAANSDQVDMVGIGTRDDYELAEGFLADTGVVNFPLYWEETGQSWVDNAVAAQPYMILFIDGEDVERWPGGASVRQLEDALAQYG